MAKAVDGLLKNTATYAAGTFGSKVLAFLIVPLYSYYLNTEQFGYFDLILTSVNLLVPLISLQISDALFRWLLKAKGSVDLENTVITNALLLLIFSVLIVALTSSVWYAIQPMHGHFLIMWMTIGALIYPFMQQLARGLAKNKLFAWNGAFYTVIYLAGNILLLMWLSLGVEALLISNIVAYFTASLYILFKLKVYERLDRSYISLPIVKEFISYSIPLIPNTISWWMINSANKFIVLTFLGVGYNGLFAMAGRLPVILVMVNQVFTLAWQEKAIRGADNKEGVAYALNTKVLRYLVKFQLSLVFFLTLLSEVLIYYFFSDAYYNSWYYMPVMFLGVSFLSISSFYGAFYLGNMKTKKLFTTTLYAGSINVIISIVLVQIIGLMGVVIGTSIGFLFLFLIRASYARKHRYVDFPILSFFKYIILVMISFLITYSSPGTIILTASVIGGLAFVIFDNLSILKNLKKKPHDIS